MVSPGFSVQRFCYFTCCYSPHAPHSASRRNQAHFKIRHCFEIGHTRAGALSAFFLEIFFEAFLNFVRFWRRFLFTKNYEAFIRLNPARLQPTAFDKTPLCYRLPTQRLSAYYAELPHGAFTEKTRQQALSRPHQTNMPPVPQTACCFKALC
jgi:hypothetical protein